MRLKILFWKVYIFLIITFRVRADETFIGPKEAWRYVKSQDSQDFIELARNGRPKNDE